MDENYKLEYDCERFRLMSYQLEDLLEEYDKLFEIRRNIQLKFFMTLKNLQKNDIEVSEDYQRWEKVLSSERHEWNKEIDLIADLKYDIDDNLKLLDNVDMRHSLINNEIKKD